MQLMTIAIALVATSAFVAAAPAQENSLQARSCPNGWSFCGECNGTSCKVAGINYSCGYGTSCTKQSGGGDGALCGSDDYLEGPYHCPGHS